MKFSKEDLQDLARGDHRDEFEVIKDEIVDTSRWSNIYEMIFKYDDRFYQTSYSVGATECQDERPYEYESDEIECDEVIPVEVTKIEYVRRKD